MVHIVLKTFALVKLVSILSLVFIFVFCVKKDQKSSLNDDQFLNEYVNHYVLPDPEYRVSYEPLPFYRFSSLKNSTINDSLSGHEYYLSHWNFAKTESYFYWILGFCDVPNVRHELIRSIKMNQIKKVDKQFYLYNKSDGNFRRYEFTKKYFLIHDENHIKHYIKSSKTTFDKKNLTSTFTAIGNFQIEMQFISEPNIYTIRIFQHGNLILKDLITHNFNLTNLPT